MNWQRNRYSVETFSFQRYKAGVGVDSLLVRLVTFLSAQSLPVTKKTLWVLQTCPLQK